MRIFLMVLCIFISFSAIAEAPSCHQLSGGNYCSYKGIVQRVYMNDAGLILIYFDAPLPLEDAAAVGFTISQGAAGAFVLQTNPEFAKILYSTALSAKVSGTPINLQMRGTQNGYMKIDRIWM